MNKKVLNYLVIATLAVSAVFSSCTKFEDGGYYSKSRLTGEKKVWILALYSEGGGEEYSYPFNNIRKIQFKKDYTGLVLWSGGIKYQIPITWSYDKKNNKLTIDGLSESIPNEFTILKLTSNDLWLSGKKNDGTVVVYKFWKDYGWEDAPGIFDSLI